MKLSNRFRPGILSLNGVLIFSASTNCFTEDNKPSLLTEKPILHVSRSQLTKISSIPELKTDSGPTRPDIIGEFPLSLCRSVVLGTLKVLLAFNMDDPFYIAIITSLTFNNKM